MSLTAPRSKCSERREDIGYSSPRKARCWREEKRASSCADACTCRFLNDSAAAMRAPKGNYWLLARFCNKFCPRNTCIRRTENSTGFFGSSKEPEPMTQFAFLQSEWPEIAVAASRAEGRVFVSTYPTMIGLIDVSTFDE